MSGAEDELESLRATNESLVADNTAKDAELAFLRERLTNLSSLVDELDLVLDSIESPLLSPKREPPRPPEDNVLSQSSPAFPGVKLRRETVLSSSGAGTKLALHTPTKQDRISDGSEERNSSEKKRGFFGKRHHPK